MAGKNISVKLEPDDDNESHIGLTRPSSISKNGESVDVKAEPNDAEDVSPDWQVLWESPSTAMSFYTSEAEGLSPVPSDSVESQTKQKNRAGRGSEIEEKLVGGRSDSEGVGIKTEPIERLQERSPTRYVNHYNLDADCQGNVDESIVKSEPVYFEKNFEQNFSQSPPSENSHAFKTSPHSAPSGKKRKHLLDGYEEHSVKKMREMDMDADLVSGTVTQSPYPVCLITAAGDLQRLHYTDKDHLTSVGALPSDGSLRSLQEKTAQSSTQDNPTDYLKKYLLMRGDAKQFSGYVPSGRKPVCTDNTQPQLRPRPKPFAGVRRQSNEWTNEQMEALCLSQINEVQPGKETDDKSDNGEGKSVFAAKDFPLSKKKYKKKSKLVLRSNSTIDRLKKSFTLGARGDVRSSWVPKLFQGKKVKLRGLLPAPPGKSESEANSTNAQGQMSSKATAKSKYSPSSKTVPPSAQSSPVEGTSSEVEQGLSGNSQKSEVIEDDPHTKASYSRGVVYEGCLCTQQSEFEVEEVKVWKTVKPCNKGYDASSQLENLGLLRFMNKSLFSFSKHGRLYIYLAEVHFRGLLPVSAEEREYILSDEMICQYAPELQKLGVMERDFVDSYGSMHLPLGFRCMITPYGLNLIYKALYSFSKVHLWYVHANSIFYKQKLGHHCAWTLQVTPPTQCEPPHLMNKHQSVRMSIKTLTKVNLDPVTMEQKFEEVRLCDGGAGTSIDNHGLSPSLGAALKHCISSFGLDDIAEPFCSCCLSINDLYTSMCRPLSINNILFYQVTRLHFLNANFFLHCWKRNNGFYISLNEFLKAGCLPSNDHKLLAELLVSARFGVDICFMYEAEMLFLKNLQLKKQKEKSLDSCPEGMSYISNEGSDSLETTEAVINFVASIVQLVCTSQDDTEYQTSEAHSSDDITADAHSSDDITADAHSSDDITADVHSSDDITADAHSSDDITADVHSSDDITADAHSSKGSTAKNLQTAEKTLDKDRENSQPVRQSILINLLFLRKMYTELAKVKQKWQTHAKAKFFIKHWPHACPLEKGSRTVIREMHSRDAEEEDEEESDIEEFTGEQQGEDSSEEQMEYFPTENHPVGEERNDRIEEDDDCGTTDEKDEETEEKEDEPREEENSEVQEYDGSEDCQILEGVEEEENEIIDLVESSSEEEDEGRFGESQSYGTQGHIQVKKEAVEAVEISPQNVHSEKPLVWKDDTTTAQIKDEDKGEHFTKPIHQPEKEVSASATAMRIKQEKLEQETDNHGQRSQDVRYEQQALDGVEVRQIKQEKLEEVDADLLDLNIKQEISETDSCFGYLPIAGVSNFPNSQTPDNQLEKSRKKTLSTATQQTAEEEEEEEEEEEDDSDSETLSFKPDKFPHACSCPPEPKNSVLFPSSIVQSSFQRTRCLVVHSHIGQAIIDEKLLYTFSMNNRVYFSIAQLQDLKVLFYGVQLKSLASHGPFIWLQKASPAEIFFLSLSGVLISYCSAGHLNEARCYLMSAELLCFLSYEKKVVWRTLRQSNIFIHRVGHICPDSRSMAAQVLQKTLDLAMVMKAWTKSFHWQKQLKGVEERRLDGNQPTVKNTSTSTTSTSAGPSVESPVETDKAKHKGPSQKPAFQQHEVYAASECALYLRKYKNSDLKAEAKIVKSSNTFYVCSPNVTGGTNIVRSKTVIGEEVPDNRAALCNIYEGAMLPKWFKDKNKCLKTGVGFVELDTASISDWIGNKATTHHIILTGTLTTGINCKSSQPLTFSCFQLNDKLFINWGEVAAQMVGIGTIYNLARKLHVFLYSSRNFLGLHFAQHYGSNTDLLCSKPWVCINSMNSIAGLGLIDGVSSKMFPKTFGMLVDHFQKTDWNLQFRNFVLVPKDHFGLP